MSTRADHDPAGEPAPIRRYRCPTCNKQHEAGPEVMHRPFCSPRCQLVDLGQWLDEAFRVSRPLGPDDHE